MNEPTGFSFNLIIVGECQAGKSNLVYRWSNQLAYNWENVRTPTLWINGASRISQAGGMPVRINIWEFTGRESFHDRFHQLYTYADALVVLYDITSRESFEKCQIRLHSLRERCPRSGLFLLMGNKCDLEEERQVSFEEGSMLEEEWGLRFFEISAKTGENINYTIQYIQNELIERKDIEEEKMRIKRIENKSRMLRLKREKQHFYEILLGVVIVSVLCLWFIGYNFFSFDSFLKHSSF